MRRVFGTATRMPWRRILVGVAILIIVLIALAAFFVATFDANSHKARLTSIVKQTIGRELSIPGDIKLKLFPNVRVELERAILNEKNSSAPFASIEAVKLSLRPWPLLKSQLILDQVEIGNFDLALKRFANGTTNFDDLISKDESPSPFRFDLAGLTIKNGAVKFDDELNQRKSKLSNLQVTTGRLTENVASPIRAQFLLTNDNPAAKLKTDFNSEIKFDIQKKHYTLNGIQVKANGGAVGLSPIDIGLRGSIDAGLGANHIAIQEWSTIIDGRSGTQSLHGEFAAPKINLAGSNADFEKISAQLKIDDPPRKIRLSANVPTLTNANGKLDAPNFKLEYGLEQDAIRSSGALNGALVFDAAQQKASMPSMTFTSKTTREKLIVDANAMGPISLDLQTGEFDAIQLNGDWRMQNEQDQLAGKWRAPIAANIADGNFAVDRVEGDWSGKLAGADVTGKMSVPVQGNFREYGARIPAIDFQTNVKWSDSGLEANIHADLEASSQADQLAAKGVSIKANGYNPSGKWKADLTSPVKMDFTKQVAELSKLAGTVSWNGVSKEAKPFDLKLNGAGNVDLTHEQARFNLKAGLDQSKFVGAFGVNGWADPGYRIDARLDQIDLDRYFPPATKVDATKQRPKKSTPANLDLTFLKPLKIDGQVRIGVLKSSGTTARNVKIEMESAQPKKTKP
jgi:AsmA family